MLKVQRSALVALLALTALAAVAASDPAPVFVREIGQGILTVQPGMGTDPSGNLYVCDPPNHRIVKFNDLGTVLSTFGSDVLDYPIDVDVAPDGTIYVSDLRKIFVFDVNGAYIRSWLSGTTRLALDPTGSLIYTRHAGIWRVFGSDSTLIAQWGTFNGTDTYNIDATADGVLYGQGGVIYGYTASATQFKYMPIQSPPAGGPNAVAVDDSGDIYVTTVAPNVEKYSPDGTLLYSFGSYGGGDGQFLAESPDIAIGQHGDIFVSDGQGSPRIQLFNDSATPAARSSWGALKRRFR